MEWLEFHQDDSVLTIIVIVQKLLDVQPKTVEATDLFCEEIYTSIDKINQYCTLNSLTQECTTDLQGINLKCIKPHIMVRLIWNIFQYTKKNILMNSITIHNNTSPIIPMLIKTCQQFIPQFMRIECI